MPRPLRQLIAALAIAVLPSGCAGTAVRAHAPSVPTMRVVSLDDGRTLDDDAFGRRLAEARAIYVGERHDDVRDHRAQALVVERTIAVDPSVALGLEMVARPWQGALDAWTAGQIDDAELVSRTEWSTRWGIDFSMYRPALVAVREVGGRVLALNAPREVTRAIGRGGLEALEPDVRAALPDLDRENAAHRAMVTEALGANHGAEGEGSAMDLARLERFYLAQVVWDESMGEGVARALSAPDAPARIVVLAGRMHVERGLGIPRCAARRLPGLRSLIVLPLDEEELADAIGAAEPVADLAIVVGPASGGGNEPDTVAEHHAD